LDIKI